MNERILELAAEAEDYADSIVDQGGEFHLAYTQKFAELIVRECMELTRWKDFDMSVEQRIRLSVYQDIKEHFGVEE